VDILSLAFSSPKGIDFYEGRLYVIDMNSIFVIDQKKQLIAKWPLPKGIKGGNGLKVDNKKIYFTTHGSHYLYIYNLEGKLIQTFGQSIQRGTCDETTKTVSKLSDDEDRDGEGIFDQPEGITCDEQYLYICDTNNDRIQVLRKDNGTFVRQWGSFEDENGTIQCPSQILHHQGLLYVSDYGRVLVFTPEGFFRQRFGKYRGSGLGEFHYPRGLCVVNNQLYVADSNNRRLQIFL